MTAASTSRSSSGSSEPRTRLVAVGLASNAVGTINPVPHIARLAHAAGARLWVDAVHAAPHLALDVTALGADFLVCSAYKFYGPHLGVLWGRREALEALPLIRVRPAGDGIPGRFETGTQAHELLAGLGGTIAYLEKVGVTQGGAAGLPGAADGRRRSRLLAAMAASRRYETDLVRQLLERVSTIPGLRVRGITDPARSGRALPDDRVHARGPPSAGTSPASWASAASTCGTATTTPGSSSGRSASPSRAAWSASASCTTTRPTRSSASARALEELVAGRLLNGARRPRAPPAGRRGRQRAGLSRRGAPASPAAGRAASRAAASRGR